MYADSDSGNERAAHSIALPLKLSQAYEGFRSRHETVTRLEGLWGNS